jgi:hypothetical protein
MSQVTTVVFLINIFLFKAKIMPLDFEVAHGYQQWQTIEL